MANYKDKNKEKYKKILFIPGWRFCNEIWKKFASEFFDLNNCIFIDFYEYLYNANGDIKVAANEVLNDYKDIDLVFSWSLGCFMAKEIEYLLVKNPIKIVYVAYTPNFMQTDSWNFGFNIKTINKLRLELEKDREKALKNFYLLILGIHKNKNFFYKIMLEHIDYVMKVNLKKLYIALDVLQTCSYNLSFHNEKNKNLYIYGKEDSIVSSNIAHLVEKNEPSAKVITIINSSHIPFLTNEEEFAEILRKNI